ncbi:hypothetical protein Ciccas_008407 [Cichlidogyrus casuarinus]|uniref:Uncharacterized protein n=1 Tax=Cichlidogyrus casuarinus TaxID=1844966 RepID=A0ABD2Q061_9PLAT
MSKQDDVEQTIEKLKTHYALIESSSEKFKRMTENLCQTIEEKENEIRNLRKELADLRAEFTLSKVTPNSENQESPTSILGCGDEDTLMPSLQILEADVRQIKEKFKNETKEHRQVLEENYRLKEELIISKQAEIDLSFQLFSAKDREALVREQCANQDLEKDDTISGLNYEIKNLKRVINRMEIDLKESKSEFVPYQY